MVVLWPKKGIGCHEESRGQIIPKLREGEVELVRGNQGKTLIHAGSRCAVRYVLIF